MISMKRIALLFTLVLLLSSCGCFEFTSPEVRGGEEFKIEKIDGNKIQLNAKANVYNENCFSVKMKPSTLDLYIDGENIGTIRLNKKVKMKRKSETAIDADVTATLTDGSLMKLMAYASKPEIEVRLKGKAKGGIFIFSKKFEIDETRKISGSNFKMGL